MANTEIPKEVQSYLLLDEYRKASKDAIIAGWNGNPVGNNSIFNPQPTAPLAPNVGNIIQNYKKILNNVDNEAIPGTTNNNLLDSLLALPAPDADGSMEDFYNGLCNISGVNETQGIDDILNGKQPAPVPQAPTSDILANLIKDGNSVMSSKLRPDKMCIGAVLADGKMYGIFLRGGEKDGYNFDFDPAKLQGKSAQEIESLINSGDIVVHFREINKKGSLGSSVFNVTNTDDVNKILTNQSFNGISSAPPSTPAPQVTTETNKKPGLPKSSILTALMAAPSLATRTSLLNQAG